MKPPTSTEADVCSALQISNNILFVLFIINSFEIMQP